MIRFILSLGPRTTIGQTEFNQVGLLSTVNRAKQMILVNMFDVKKNSAPSYLTQNFAFIDHNYSTRGSQINFIVPRPIGVTAANFAYNSTTLWNELPSSLKRIQNKNTFKHKIRKRLSLQTSNAY